MSVETSPFTRLARFAVERPRWVVAVALALAAASLVLAATRLELRTSNLDLVDPDLPEVARFRRVAETWGTPNVLAVVLEAVGADDSESTRRDLAAAVEHVSPRLAELPDTRAVIDRLPIDPGVAAWSGIDPYLRSRDGGLAVLFVQPDDPESRADRLEPFVREVRRVLDEADLGALGVRAGLTGMPAYALDDRDVIERDVSRLSLFGFVLVGLLVFLAFRDRRRPALVLAALALAVAVGLGVTALWPGHLTLLSAFFASILFGLGVDFGIHVLDRLEEIEPGVDLAEAVPHTVGALGPALTTGAATSSAVFFAMQAGGFRGFAELGFIAGVGVLLCLFATLTVLPALLVLRPGRSAPSRPHRRRLGRAIASLHRHPAGRVGAWALAGLAALAAISPPPPFDADYSHLQPVDSESVRLERELVERSELSPVFAVFEVASAGEREGLEQRLLAEPTVGAVREPFPAVDDSKQERGSSLVYAFPAGDVWRPEVRDAFLAAVRAIDPEVTGLPLLGDFMVQRTWRAVEITGGLGAVLLLVCVGLGLRRPLPTLFGVLPAFGTVAALHGLMRLVGLDYNPLDLMALPVVLGIAVDDGVHVVHRFLAEDGDLDRALVGTGRAVFLTSATTLAAFGCLVFADHRGLASFAAVLCLGVASALVLSLWILPELLRWARPWLVPRPADRPAAVSLELAE